jgi:uncharacterized OB-fold protein
MKPWIPEVLNTLGLDGGEIRLIGSECPLCKKVYFPPMRICPDCLNDMRTPGTIFLSDIGTIHSFSVARVAPPGFEAPHVQAYVDLDEGVRIFALLVQYGDENRLKKGLAAELVIVNAGEDEEGIERLGYRFRPVFEEDDR